MVDELVDPARVARHPDSGDRRAVVIDATPGGPALPDTLAGHRRTAAIRLAGGLSRGDLETLRALLQRLDEGDRASP